MQNLFSACNRRLLNWRKRRRLNRIHRQALRRARISYDAIPLNLLSSISRERERQQVPGGGKS